MFAAIFILIGAVMIIYQYDINLTQEGGKENFANQFGKWLVQLGKNSVKVVGYAIHQPWLPDKNVTNETLAAPVEQPTVSQPSTCEVVPTRTTAF